MHVLQLITAHLLRLDAVQERLEQRREAYRKYVERVAQSLTQQCAKSPSGVAQLKLASRQGGAGDADV